MWLPAEVNTSIRPGWFYHPDEDDQVKSVEQLVDNWFHSVGMNGNFLLNLPVDRRGLVHENDIKALMELKEFIDEAFSEDYSQKAEFSASDVRGKSEMYSAKNVNDKDPDSFWATNDDVLEACLEAEFQQPVEINGLMIREYIKLGQRIRSFTVEAMINDEFIVVGEGTTVGNRRIIQFPEILTKRVRVTFDSKAPVVIASVEMYRIPDIKTGN
jgi:alpha-L-fucosidase